LLNVSADDWKILGQEQDGSFMVSWDAVLAGSKQTKCSNLGIYNMEQNILKVSMHQIKISNFISCCFIILF
jgi:hypothetical protein